MTRFTLLLVSAALGTSACIIDAPHYVTPDDEHEVGGVVEGMWDGAAVVLRIQADAVDEQLTVNANGAFAFAPALADGASFSVTIVTTPQTHSCAVAGGAGTIDGADYEDVHVSCSGPPVDVSLSAPISWNFAPDTLSYALDTSLLTQALSVVVNAPDASEIRVNDEVVASGAPSTAFSLTPGANTLDIAVYVGELSRQYTLGIDRGAAAVEQHVYAKASNTGAGDRFGEQVVVDGDTMAVGAYLEDSSSTVINGPQDNDDRQDSGAVYVFRRVGTEWQQEAYLKASNAGAGDEFGLSLSLSGDTLVVGAPFEDDVGNSVSNGGAAYVFVRNGTQWSEQGILRVGDPAQDRHLGAAVTIDGDVVAVGGAELVNNPPAYVFRRSGTTWIQEDRILPPGTGNALFGASMAVDNDVLVIGNPSATGHEAHVFRFNGGDWAPETVLYGHGGTSPTSDMFGARVAISGDMIAVGAWFDASNGRGVNPAGTTNNATNSGAVYVFRNTLGTWTEEAFIKSSNSDAGDQFGFGVAVWGDILAVGAATESSADTGVSADETDNTAPGAGAVYVFEYSAGAWHQISYAKASNAQANDNFGAVAVSRDTLIAGARAEDSGASGLGGTQGDAPAGDASGAAYVFR